MIRKRLLWLFVLQIVLVLLISGVYLQFKLRTTLEKELGARLEALAATIAEHSDVALLTLLSPGDESGRVYKSMQARWAALAKAGQLNRIVAFNPSGRVWLDSQDRLTVGEPYFRYEFDRTEIDRVLTAQNSQSPLFTGQDGLLYKSGYAPLRSGTAVVGVVAVEGSAASLQRVREMQSSLLQIGLFSLLLAVALSWFTSQRLTRPLQRLRRSAERLGQGDWDAAIPVSGQDEIAFLAATMEEMRRNIVQRVEQQKAMMAGVAHELRNPIGGIELFAGLIHDENPDPETRQRAQRILKESRNLQLLVQSFLDYARPILARPQECLISECWQEAIDLVQGEPDAQTIDFHRQGDARAWVDPQHLRQVLLNLLFNAVQAMPQKNGRVEMRVVTVGNQCHLDLSDNGRGIPEEFREKIFTPFFSSKEKGLGLGLVMVKNLLTANNGSISLIASDAKGSTFRVTLPTATKN